MKQKYIHITIGIFLFILFAMQNISAQDNSQTTSTSWLKNKLEIGGNFGFNIGNRMGAVEFSPTFGIRPIKNLYTALGVICQYSWDSKADIDVFSYGFGLSARYTIISNIYVSAQYTYNPYVVHDKLYNTKSYGNTSGLWLGAGYIQPINTRMYIYGGIVYNILADPYVDDNPKIHGGISYQF